MIGLGNHGLYCVFLGLSRGDANRNFSQLVISQTLSSWGWVMSCQSNEEDDPQLISDSLRHYPLSSDIWPRIFLRPPRVRPGHRRHVWLQLRLPLSLPRGHPQGQGVRAEAQVVPTLSQLEPLEHLRWSISIVQHFHLAKADRAALREDMGSELFFVICTSKRKKLAFKISIDPGEITICS